MTVEANTATPQGLMKLFSQCAEAGDIAHQLRCDPASNRRHLEGAREPGVAELGQLSTAAALMRSHPDYVAPETLGDRISELGRSGTFEILE